MKKKPNILWIITDQQSHYMMRNAGNYHIATPNIDYLAKEGVKFDNAYCTNPVCAPSRFSLMTGVYPGAIGVRSNDCSSESKGPIDAIKENALGKLLKREGYEVVYGGKEHLPFLGAKALGFDYLTEDERESLAITSEAYLKNYNKEAPFCMVASFINPHDICLLAISNFIDDMDPEEAAGMKSYFKDIIPQVQAMKQLEEGIHPDIFYDTMCPPLPPNHMPAADEPEAITLLQKERNFKHMARKKYTERDWKLHRYIYGKLTEQVDKEIGRVLNGLKCSGQWDNTVIVFTSDHGDMDSAHKMEHKECLYEEACHVPLIIKGIKNRAGAVDSKLVSNGLDCICTVLEYAGITCPDYMKGISLKSNVEQEKSDFEREYLIIECENGIAAVGKNYKYVCYDKGYRNEQFYDFKVNRLENYNQINEIQYKGIIDDMREAVSNHQKKIYRSMESS